jgi:hypothetical protein
MGVMLHEDGILTTMADRLRFATNVPLQETKRIWSHATNLSGYQSSSPSLEWEPHHNFRSHISSCCHLPCRVIQLAINEYDELRQFTDCKNKASVSPKSAHHFCPRICSSRRPSANLIPTPQAFHPGLTKGSDMLKRSVSVLMGAQNGNNVLIYR